MCHLGSTELTLGCLIEHTVSASGLVSSKHGLPSRNGEPTLYYTAAVYLNMA